MSWFAVSVGVASAYATAYGYRRSSQEQAFREIQKREQQAAMNAGMNRLYEVALENSAWVSVPPIPKNNFNGQLPILFGEWLAWVVVPLGVAGAFEFVANEMKQGVWVMILWAAAGLLIGLSPLALLRRRSKKWKKWLAYAWAAAWVVPPVFSLWVRMVMG